MGFMRSMNISSSALTAQRFRMDVIAENLANATTTRTANGQPYRRRTVTFQEREQIMPFSDYLYGSLNAVLGNGVRAASVEEDPTDFKIAHDPGHPDADEEGYVRLPNVDTAHEMIDMISATRSYEANVTAMNAFKNMALKALDIGKS